MTDDENSDDLERIETTAIGSNYKILGRNDSTSSDAVGVKGAVPNADGYGLYTPDDARIDGDIAATSGHRLTVGGDRGLRVGPTDTDTTGSGVTYTVGGSVVGGYQGNTTNGALGATIAGGGGERTDNAFNELLTAPNEVTDRYGTVGGGAANQAGDAKSGTTNAKFATVAGGFDNLAGTDRSGSSTGAYATVGGGEGNTASGAWATVGGGFDNTASGDESTVGGGIGNDVSSENATVGGGFDNDVSGDSATVGGGQNHIASGQNSTVCGGFGNTASGEESTVGGGERNTASGNRATVGGGAANTASGQYSTVGGGSNNTTGKSGTNKGDYATVPGGRDNRAQEDYSFAAGRQAKAKHSGTFVWNDGTSGSVTSATSGAFLVHAGNGAGINTPDPVSGLHVKGNVAESGSGNLGRHVVAIQNTNSDKTNTGADCLGIELTNVTEPGSFNNFISFMDSSGTIGSIQGDDNGNVVLDGSTADFAEHFPKADPDRTFEDGEVVGLKDGEVVPASAEADAALVVSTAPIVTGNRPVDGDRSDFVELSLVGQVPVQVSGSVESGDLLVASPEDDGTAVAARRCDADRPVVGIALADCEGDEKALSLVGGPGVDALSGPAETTGGGSSTDLAALRVRPEEKTDRIERLERENETMRSDLERKDDRIEDLEAKNEDLEAANEQLRARLAAVEDHLGLDGGAEPTPADD